MRIQKAGGNVRYRRVAGALGGASVDAPRELLGRGALPCAVFSEMRLPAVSLGEAEVGGHMS